MSVLTDLRNRGVRDVFFLVCDGLKGLPEVVGNVWPHTIVQTCIIHLIRNTFRLSSKRDWDALKRAVKPIYTAVNAAATRAAFDQLTETWGTRYPAIIRLWDNAWHEFIPFLDYDLEIRPLPPRCQGSRAFPHRAGRVKVPVSGHPIPRPDRRRQGPMGNALEARPQHPRHHLRRPVPGRRELKIRRKYRWRNRPLRPAASRRERQSARRHRPAARSGAPRSAVHKGLGLAGYLYGGGTNRSPDALR
jgi:putative transposase